MGQLAFNRIRSPSHLVEECGGHTSESVTCHVVNSVAQSSQRSCSLCSHSSGRLVLGHPQLDAGEPLAVAAAKAEHSAWPMPVSIEAHLDAIVDALGNGHQADTLACDHGERVGRPAGTARGPLE